MCPGTSRLFCDALEGRKLYLANKNLSLWSKCPQKQVLGKGRFTLIFLGKYKPHILSLFWKYGINRFLSRVKSNKTKEKSEAKALLLTHINEVGDLSASGLHDPE